ncbi:hypothetical protein WN51_14017 [Melipona quadrifasciata]|uniref:Uncharacterized protein n=1 Tax=Melipona quadrifasciata TaxID=166423 RepID=A0A0M9A1L1_9HYME|nr:hypothetical protein WN51_14017 [Melipona quadrifasciata]
MADIATARPATPRSNERIALWCSAGVKKPREKNRCSLNIEKSNGAQRSEPKIKRKVTRAPERRKDPCELLLLLRIVIPNNEYTMEYDLKTSNDFFLVAWPGVPAKPGQRDAAPRNYPEHSGYPGCVLDINTGGQPAVGMATIQWQCRTNSGDLAGHTIRNLPEECNRSQFLRVVELNSFHTPTYGTNVLGRGERCPSPRSETMERDQTPTRRWTFRLDRVHRFVLQQTGLHEKIFWNVFGLIINTHDWLAIQLIVLTLAAVHLPDPIPAAYIRRKFTFRNYMLNQTVQNFREMKAQQGNANFSQTIEVGTGSAGHDEVSRRSPVAGVPFPHRGWYVEATCTAFGWNRRGGNVWSGQIPFRLADLPPATQPPLSLTADRTQKFASLLLRSPHLAGETTDFASRRNSDKWLLAILALASARPHAGPDLNFSGPSPLPPSTVAKDSRQLMVKSLRPE